jgi:hypothetical protein
MKCAWCKEEIPPAEQQYKTLFGERIPSPHAECIEEIKKLLWKPDGRRVKRQD